MAVDDEHCMSDTSDQLKQCVSIDLQNDEIKLTYGKEDFKEYDEFDSVLLQSQREGLFAQSGLQ